MCVCVLIQRHRQTDNDYCRISTHPLHTAPPAADPCISGGFESDSTGLYHIYRDS